MCVVHVEHEHVNLLPQCATDYVTMLSENSFSLSIHLSQLFKFEQVKYFKHDDQKKNNFKFISL